MRLQAEDGDSRGDVPCTDCADQDHLAYGQIGSAPGHELRDSCAVVYGVRCGMPILIADSDGVNSDSRDATGYVSTTLATFTRDSRWWL